MTALIKCALISAYRVVCDLYQADRSEDHSPVVHNAFNMAQTTDATSSLPELARTTAV